MRQTAKLMGNVAIQATVATNTTLPAPTIEDAVTVVLASRAHPDREWGDRAEHDAEDVVGGSLDVRVRRGA
jgi:hypothetical protein